ncbi:MAG: FGGY family carbohydrate kinase [Acidimicrobiales bacterium]
MTGVVLAIDQGTSSTRCFVVGADLAVRATATRPVTSSFPSVGWVEQDPEEIALGAAASITEAMQRAGVAWSEIRGIGIDNQTETFVVWERATGRPIYPAIVWQCRRTAEACARLREHGHEAWIRERTGLELDPSFSATKLAWVLDHVDGARTAAEAGELAFGDVACWLIWRLSGGAAHVTEPSNASRSLLLGLDDLQWDDRLLDLFGIPAALLPAIQPTGSVFAETSPDVIGAAVPIAGALGDQQAALFGQHCWSEGDTKVTLGTGAFIWANAGAKVPSPPEGILATCAWRLDDETAYAFEGFIPVAGAAVSWLVDAGVLADPQASEALLRTLDEGEAEAVWFVPALTGLGAPVWDPYTKGTIFGLTRATSGAHLVKAALDGVVHQIVDAVEAMETGIAGGVGSLRVDGGMARNDWLLQRLADLLARPVDRPTNPEATGLGAATVAGLTVGLWSSRTELEDRWALDRRFEPAMAPAGRARLRERWSTAVDAARSWR